MKNLIQTLAVSLLFFCFSVNSFSQNVGISAAGDPVDNSAGLDVNFTNKGLLIPRVSLTSATDITTINSPATSLLVYNINAGMTGGSIGYWYWDGTIWVKLNAGVTAPGWSVLGNSGTVYGTNFLGTTDNTGISLRTNNMEALHIDSLQNVGIGVQNTTNKFEVEGTFRLHKDSFNLLHTTDLFPLYIPGIEFIGSAYHVPSGTGAYLNGIADVPPAGGDVVYGLTGYLDLPSNKQNLLLSSDQGIMMNAQSGNDTSTNMSLGSTGLNFYHGVNAVGNTNMNFNDSSVNLNVSENVTNSRNSNMQIGPDNYNFYNNDNQNNTYSGLNFNSRNYNLYVGSPNGNTNLNLADTSVYQNINSGFSNRSTGFNIKPDDYNIYNNDNALNTNSSYNFNSKGFSHSVNDNNQGLNTFLAGQIGELKLYLNDNANNKQTGFDITNSNSSFFNNDNAVGNNASYNLSNNSFSVNINNATDNRTTVLNIDQNNLNFNQNNNNTGTSSNLNLSDNGVSMASNNAISTATFLMNGTTGSFTSNTDMSIGIGTSTPNSSLETAGSFGTAITITSSDITLDRTHHTIIINGGTPVISLPTAGADNNRRTYRIINQTASAISISSYIDFTGSSAVDMPAASKIEVQSDGSNWYRVD